MTSASLVVAGDGDVMVFLHMQKTGGTFFGKNLVKNLKLDTPCKCAKGEGMLKCPCMSKDQKRYVLVLECIIVALIIDNTYIIYGCEMQKLALSPCLFFIASFSWLKLFLRLWMCLNKN